LSTMARLRGRRRTDQPFRTSTPHGEALSGRFGGGEGTPRRAVPRATRSYAIRVQEFSRERHAPRRPPTFARPRTPAARAGP
jgi:hypothetical protein